MPQEIAVIRLDVAKKVFQVHAIAHDGSPVVRGSFDELRF